MTSVVPPCSNDQQSHKNYFVVPSFRLMFVAVATRSLSRVGDMAEDYGAPVGWHKL